MNRKLKALFFTAGLCIFMCLETGSLSAFAAEMINVSVGFSLGDYSDTVDLEVKENSSAWNCIKTAADKLKLKITGSSSYIRYITTPAGKKYGEFMNDTGNDGIMYEVNGSKPNISVGAYKVSDGDSIEVFYTEDYTSESYDGDDSMSSGGTSSGTGGNRKGYTVSIENADYAGTFSTGTAIGPGASQAALAAASSSTETKEVVAMIGTWEKDTEGKYHFTGRDGKTPKNTWAYINDDDALNGAPFAYWYRFDENGAMLTGFYTDENGNTFYLDENEGAGYGAMMIGWQWIKSADGKEYCYYFEKTGAEMGHMYKSLTTTDGNVLGPDGRWKKDGIVQSR